MKRVRRDKPSGPSLAAGPSAAKRETKPLFKRTATPDRARSTGGSAKAWQVYTPTKPKLDMKSFVGREHILEKAVQAIEEEHAHVIMHGPRGIGKTSAANILAGEAQEAGYQIVRYPCDSGTSYEELFRFFLRSLPVDMMDRSIRGRNPNLRAFDELVSEGAFGPTELSSAVQFLIEPAIFIVDEFDRIQSDEFRRKFAETMKNVADISDRITFVVLGVGNTLHDLIGDHPSVHRHIRSIHIPFMSDEEISNLIEMGEKESGIRFDDEARQLAMIYSAGLPYLAQLFCLHATRAAVERDLDRVGLEEIEQARLTLLDETDPSLAAQYATATKGERNSHMLDIIYAASACTFDEYGSFTTADVSAVLSRIRGFDTPFVTTETSLRRLCSERGGMILENVATSWGGKRFVFANPAMRQCVLLKQPSRVLGATDEDSKRHA